MAPKTSTSTSQHELAYAGIGSRETPPPMLAQMTRIAATLASQGWVLRTGMAPGADQAFYRGAIEHGPIELYLPWPSFEADARRPATTTGSEFVLGRPARTAYAMAERFHPAWSQLSKGARHLHARNCHQVLGPDLNTPARFVVCWTPDGSLDGRGRRVGGTGQALRIANHHRIPVFNLARPDHIDLLQAALIDQG
jgi:hypothetical protein